MNKINKYTDRDWEELAMLLSDEKKENSDILARFEADDSGNTGIQWKELGDMSDKEEINVDEAWNKLYSKLDYSDPLPDQKPGLKVLRRTFLLRVAAIAVIVLSIGSLAVYLTTSGYLSKKIMAATGNEQKNLLVALPDGSKIFLNRNTELSYRMNFGKQSRKVSLKGEAFFEISPDTSKPFVIDAGNANVKVVGTSFNVITKNDKAEVEVFVKTGKVLLSDNSGFQSVTLDPGYIGTIDSKISEKKQNNNPNYLSWNTGLLVYNGQKLNVVFKDLKRVYNMDVVADETDILDNTWTSPIDNLPQDTIIRLICTSFNLSYTKDGNVYHLTKK